MWLAPLGFLKPFWDLLKSIPWRAWIGFAAFLLGVILVFAYGNYREDKGASRVQGMWDAASTKAAEEARKTEDGWKKGISDFATKATKERMEREAENARLTACLTDGSCGLRPRLRCPVPKPPGSRPQHDGSTSGSEEPAGIQESDLELVLRVGAAADEVSARLVQCQHFVRTITNDPSL